jgi:hypothetical protein
MLRRLRAPLPLLLVLLAAACGDAGPTGPTSFEHRAAGRTWVAVVAPDGVPGAAEWLAFVPRTDAAFARVQALRADAARARRGGDPVTAAARDEEAAALAASAASLADVPALLAVSAALERWEGRAAERADAGAHPRLAADAATVAGLRGEAAEALARGDRAAAVDALARASRTVRDWAPEAVSLRLLAQADDAIDGAPRRTPELERARHLIRSAREGIASGDHRRALRRALYALQIIEAAGLRAPDTPRD